MARRMRKRVEYRFGKSDPNNASFGAFIMSPQAMRPTVEVARSIQRRAVEISPESNDGKGVPYVDSFDVRPKPAGIIAGKYRNRRVAVEVINTAGHAPEVEFGVHDTDAGGPRAGHRVLLRAGLIMSPNR